MYQRVIIVSIPKWCDYKRGQSGRRWCLCRVSIPKWCDYKTVEPTGANRQTMFQFQNGAIISISVNSTNFSTNLFQFQNGAIIRSQIESLGYIIN